MISEMAHEQAIVLVQTTFFSEKVEKSIFWGKVHPNRCFNFASTNVMTDKARNSPFMHKTLKIVKISHMLCK